MIQDTGNNRPYKYLILSVLMLCVLSQFMIINYILNHSRRNMDVYEWVLLTVNIICIVALAYVGEFVHRRW